MENAFHTLEDLVSSEQLGDHGDWVVQNVAEHGNPGPHLQGGGVIVWAQVRGLMSELDTQGQGRKRGSEGSFWGCSQSPGDSRPGPFAPWFLVYQLH